MVSRETACKRVLECDDYGNAKYFIVNYKLEEPYPPEVQAHLEKLWEVFEDREKWGEVFEYTTSEEIYECIKRLKKSVPYRETTPKEVDEYVMGIQILEGVCVDPRELLSLGYEKKQ